MICGTAPSARGRWACRPSSIAALMVLLSAEAAGQSALAAADSGSSGPRVRRQQPQHPSGPFDRLGPADQAALEAISAHSGPSVGLNSEQCTGWRSDPCDPSNQCVGCDATNTTIATLTLVEMALKLSGPGVEC